MEVANMPYSDNYAEHVLTIEEIDEVVSAIRTKVEKERQLAKNCAANLIRNNFLLRQENEFLLNELKKAKAKVNSLEEEASRYAIEVAKLTEENETYKDHNFQLTEKYGKVWRSLINGETPDGVPLVKGRRNSILSTLDELPEAAALAMAMRGRRNSCLTT